MFAWPKKRKSLPIEQHPYATATTPDQIIAEAMKTSMAKDIIGWTKEPISLRNGRVNYAGGRRDYADRQLVNKDKSLRLTWDLRHSNYEWEEFDFRVNDIEFDRQTALDVIASYDRLKAAYDKAQATADKAKLAMQANENKWNLAESLLGMKRNEFGALVPVETTS